MWSVWGRWLGVAWVFASKLVVGRSGMKIVLRGDVRSLVVHPQETVRAQADRGRVEGWMGRLRWSSRLSSGQKRVRGWTAKYTTGAVFIFFGEKG